jgi:DNA repair protein RadC
MKYCTRTVTWRFRDAREAIPELFHIKSITINQPQDIFLNYGSLFKDQVRERFIVFWLNSANRILGFEVISEGILNSSLVHPREVFRGAIITTSAAIILAHNHPSENAEPSMEDIQITKQIAETGKIVGIPVHDHIIFAGERYTSFAERGLL